MRNLIFMALLFMCLLSCESDEDLSLESSNLIGEWVLTESFFSIGGPLIRTEVENGEELTFFENGTFSSDRFPECATGTFFVQENILFLDYLCESFESEIENEDGFITFGIELQSNSFIATPTSGPICTEGCSVRYERRQ